LPRLFGQRGRRILHLHFFDELTQHPRRMRTISRSLGFLAALTFAKQCGVKLIWTAHNSAPHETYHPDLAFLTYRYVIRHCTAVIAHSAAALYDVEQRYGHVVNGRVIPHGHYIGLYGPLAEQATSRAALGLPAHERITLSFGTLRRYKNLDGLISAFAGLPSATRGVLLIVGAAKDRAYAAELADLAAQTPGVQFRPQFIADHELPSWLAAADLIALPYQHLLTSGVLLWAFSYQRPVVAPAFGPVCELVGEGESGFLFRPGSHAELQAALARAISHPDLAALGRQGLQIAAQFDWPTIAAQTAALYREISD
jgi:glycosyltransferase involved in cell wall biosynthesis